MNLKSREAIISNTLLHHVKRGAIALVRSWDFSNLNGATFYDRIIRESKLIDMSSIASNIHAYLKNTSSKKSSRTLSYYEYYGLIKSLEACFGFDKYMRNKRTERESVLTHRGLWDIENITYSKFSTMVGLLAYNGFKLTYINGEKSIDCPLSATEIKELGDTVLSELANTWDTDNPDSTLYPRIDYDVSKLIIDMVDIYNQNPESDSLRFVDSVHLISRMKYQYYPRAIAGSLLDGHTINRYDLYVTIKILHHMFGKTESSIVTSSNNFKKNKLLEMMNLSDEHGQVDKSIFNIDNVPAFASIPLLGITAWYLVSNHTLAEFNKTANIKDSGTKDCLDLMHKIGIGVARLIYESNSTTTDS